MDSHLTAGQQALLETALQASQKELKQTLALHQGDVSRIEHARAVLDQDADDAEARDADRDVDLAMTERVIQSLSDVEAALERLRTGRYGLCIDCDAVIPFDRLTHQPQAARCVDCQSARETRDGGVPRRSI